MHQPWESLLLLKSNQNSQVWTHHIALIDFYHLLAGFPGHPADSGVGDSVGSCSNPVLGRDSIYYTRQFSAQFHDLVTLCSVLESDSRPSASELLAHPFIRQLKKTNTTLLTLLLPTQPLLSDSSQFQDEEEGLIQRMRESHLHDEDWCWDVQD